MHSPKSGTKNTEQDETGADREEKLINEDVQTAQAENTEASKEPQAHASVNRDDVKPQPRITHIDIQSDKSGEKPVVSSGLNIGVILGTLFIPLIGIAMGFTYMRKTHPDAKKTGKTWLIIGLISLLAQFIIVSTKQ